MKVQALLGASVTGQGQYLALLQAGYSLPTLTPKSSSGPSFSPPLAFWCIGRTDLSRIALGIYVYEWIISPTIMLALNACEDSCT